MFKHPRTTMKFIGHDDSTRIFENCCAQNKVHHAHLLVGKEGIGKATFAYKAAELLLTNCAENFRQIHPDVSAKVSHNSHPDLLVIEPEEEGKEIKIESVRKLSSFISLTPAMAHNKVVIIDSINDLNNNAANALLKFLEEPTPNTYFFLICHSLTGILPTIRSRCSILNFSHLDLASFAKIISNFKKLDDASVNEIYQLSGGSVKKSRQFFDEDLLDLYKNLERALIEKSMSKIELVKLSKVVTNDNWPDVRSFIERITVDKILKATEQEKNKLGTTLDRAEEVLQLVKSSDRFHIDKSQLFTVISSIL